MPKGQGWEFAHKFSEGIARFLQKNERMSNSRKKMSDLSDSLTLLMFGKRPEQIAHSCSFFVSDLSDLLTSLILGERPE